MKHAAKIGLLRSLTHKAEQRPAHEFVSFLTLSPINFGEQLFGALQIACSSRFRQWKMTNGK
jgi:hypothetical protein